MAWNEPDRTASPQLRLNNRVSRSVSGSAASRVYRAPSTDLRAKPASCTPHSLRTSLLRSAVTFAFRGNKVCKGEEGELVDRLVTDWWAGYKEDIRCLALDYSEFVTRDFTKTDCFPPNLDAR